MGRKGMRIFLDLAISLDTLLVGDQPLQFVENLCGAITGWVPCGGQFFIIMSAVIVLHFLHWFV